MRYRLCISLCITLRKLIVANEYPKEEDRKRIFSNVTFAQKTLDDWTAGFQGDEKVESLREEFFWVFDQLRSRLGD